MRKNPAARRDSRRDSVASVDKVLKLLLLLQAGGPLRITDVSAKMGIAPSTAYRLLRTLEDNAFVRQDRTTRAYLVGKNLLALGRGMTRETTFEQLIGPEVERLSCRLGESAAFGVLQGEHSGFIVWAEGKRPDRVESRVGAMFPAHASATGCALLAEVPLPILRRFYRTHTLAGGRRGAVHSWSALLEQLERIRCQGYAVSREACESGVNELAVAVKDRVGYVYGTLTVAAPPRRLRTFQMPAYAAEARASAERLAGALYDCYAPGMTPRVRWLMASRIVDYVDARKEPALQPHLSVGA
ncbi:MAG: IclR family transcriptional regulator [Candidatus Eremiobacteraeota bacterium]|nr:IclR family transcriptional regulator [Candidatus Eremiobacteraeota bacterium]